MNSQPYTPRIPASNFRRSSTNAIINTPAWNKKTHGIRQKRKTYTDEQLIQTNSKAQIKKWKEDKKGLFVFKRYKYINIYYFLKPSKYCQK